jgi:hypothetical protein
VTQRVVDACIRQSPFADLLTALHRLGTEYRRIVENRIRLSAGQQALQRLDARVSLAELRHGKRNVGAEALTLLLRNG